MLNPLREVRTIPKLINLNQIKNVQPVFKNEDKGEQHILTLSGVVSEGSIFNDQTINAKDVRNSLDDVNKDIVIRLNSGGGDVFQGVEIYNYLKALDNHVTIEITALAASAASLIAMAADKIVIRTGASMMVHEASTFAFGNKNDLKKTLNALEAIDESIIDIYAERTNLSREEITNYVNSEKWFTAAEAVKKGFADEKSNKKAIKDEPEQGGVDNMDSEKIVALLEKNERVLNKLIKNEEPDETVEEKLEKVIERLDDFDERLKELEKSDDNDGDDDPNKGSDDGGGNPQPQNKTRKFYI